MAAYLDHGATSPVCAPAVDAMVDALTAAYGNPSSGHALGRQAAERLKSHRAAVAAALGCPQERLFFTSGGTESDNWAVAAAAAAGRRTGRHIVTSAIEHAAVLEPIRALEQTGYAVTYVKPDRWGRVSAEDVGAALREDTVLVSLMLVNNETGALQPVAQVGEIIRDRRCPALLHTDAVQGFLKVPFTPAALGADLVSISGHKIGGPKGVGALYIRPGLTPTPWFRGGGQESGHRSGTEATPAIAGFAAAAAHRRAAMADNCAHMAALRDLAARRIDALPGAVILSPGDAPHILAFSLPGYPGEMVVRTLSDRGVFLSSGSACHRGKPSHVFAALGHPKGVLMGALRASFGPENTEADVFALVAGLEEVLMQRIGTSR